MLYKIIPFFQVPVSPIESQASSLLNTKRLVEHQTTKVEQILKLLNENC